MQGGGKGGAGGWFKRPKKIVLTPMKNERRGSKTPRGANDERTQRVVKRWDWYIFGLGSNLNILSGIARLATKKRSTARNDNHTLGRRSQLREDSCAAPSAPSGIKRAVKRK